MAIIPGFIPSGPQFFSPSGLGTDGQFLRTNGDGTTSWDDAAAGGVSDHGDLTGLDGDDHAQYFKVTGRSGEALTLTGATSGTATIAPTATGGVTITPQSGQGTTISSNLRSLALHCGDNGHTTEAITGSATVLSVDDDSFRFGMQGGAQGFLSVSNGSTIGFTGHLNAAEGFVVGAYSSHPFTLRGGGYSALKIDTAGNLLLERQSQGSLTGSASARFHIMGVAASDIGQIIQGVASQTGVMQQFRGISSTAAVREMLDIDTAWATSTDASRKARAIFRVWDTAAREFMRAEATGSGAKVLFPVPVGINFLNSTLPTFDLDINSNGDFNGIRVTSDFAVDVPKPGAVSLGAILNARGFGLATDSVTLGASYQPGLGIGMAMNRGTPAIGIRNDGGPAISIQSGAIIHSALPTADPAVAGQFWNDSGTVKISAG